MRKVDAAIGSDIFAIIADFYEQSICPACRPITSWLVPLISAVSFFSCCIIIMPGASLNAYC